LNLIITYLAILGGILGSFANMLIHRLPKEENIVWKRSYCPSCKHKLGILDLVPIFSYLSVLGKCRYCKKKIPIRYLLVELLNIALILSCFYVYGFSFLFFKTYIFMFGLLIIFFTDLKEQIVPDSISISFIILGLASAIYEKNILDSIYGLIIGFSIFFIIGFIAKLYYKKDALGFGDVKLIAAIGSFWGTKIMLLTTYFSFLIGGIIGLILIISGLKKRTDYIPFGPSIIIAFVTILVWGNKIWNLYLNFG
jgi:leader peptidase (prepilin peptidase) / N-methyltransferase